MEPEIGSPFDQSVIFIMVEDLDRSRRFYEDILELPVALVQEGGCRIYRTAPSAFIGICCHRGTSPHDKDKTILCLVTDKVDHWAKKLKEKSITLEKEPQDYVAPYLTLPRACGDCTVLGSSIKPDFWID